MSIFKYRFFLLHYWTYYFRDYHFVLCDGVTCMKDIFFHRLVLAKVTIISMVLEPIGNIFSLAHSWPSSLGRINFPWKLLCFSLLVPYLQKNTHCRARRFGQEEKLKKIIFWKPSEQHLLGLLWAVTWAWSLQHRNHGAQDTHQETSWDLITVHSGLLMEHALGITGSCY